MLCSVCFSNLKLKNLRTIKSPKKKPKTIKSWMSSKELEDKLLDPIAWKCLNFYKFINWKLLTLPNEFRIRLFHQANRFAWKVYKANRAVASWARPAKWSRSGQHDNELHGTPCTFWGAKRSTGAKLAQKLVQLTSPGHAPAASPAAGFLPFANAGDFPFRTRSPIFRLPRKEANSPAMGRKRARWSSS